MSYLPYFGGGARALGGVNVGKTMAVPWSVWKMFGTFMSGESIHPFRSQRQAALSLDHRQPAPRAAGARLHAQRAMRPVHPTNTSQLPPTTTGDASAGPVGAG